MRQPVDSQKVKVFISYSRQDMAAANQLVAALESAGFPVTIDRRDLPYGEEWQKELQDFLQAADTVIWLISPRSLASRWCNWELGEVVRMGKRLVPIKLTEVDAGTLPPAIGKIHILPAEGVFDLDCHFPALAETLETDRARIKQGTRLGDQAAQWNLKGKNRALLLRGRALAEAEQWSTPKSGTSTSPAPSAQVLDFILASRRSAARTLRRWAILAVLGTISASALAGWALIQWQRAEVTLEAATKGATDLVGVVARDLRDVMGIRADQINGILDAIQSLQAELAKVGRVTPALEESEARASLELSDTLAKQGDWTAALAAASRAVAISEKLAASEPPSRWARDHLFYAYRARGTSEMMLGRLAEARASFLKSIADCEKNLAAEPIRAKWKEEIGVGYSNIGEIEYRLGRHGEGLAAFQTSLRFAKEVSAADPDNKQFVFDEAAALNNVARMLFFMGRAKEAREGYAGVIQLFERVLNAEPTSSRWREAVAQAYSNVGEVEEELDDETAAVTSYVKSLEHWSLLSSSDASNLRWQISLAEMQAKLADLGDNPRKRLTAALEVFRRLESVGQLSAYEKGLMNWVESRLSKLPP